MGMGENLKSILASYRNQRDPGSICCADSERSWRRDRDDNGKTGNSGFLDHLDRNPAGQETDAAAPGPARPRQCAGQLVERVVPPHILTNSDKAGFNIPE